MDPLRILREAIKAVPAIKFALAVAGISAVVAIVLGFKIKPEIAVFGTLIVLGLMFVLVVFTIYADPSRTTTTRFTTRPAIVLVWFYTLAVMVATTLLMTSYFAGWPHNFGHSTPLLEVNKTLPIGSQAEMFVSGIVVEEGTNSPIAQATVLFVGETGIPPYITPDTGNFHISVSPAVRNHELRIRAMKAGYQTREFPLSPPADNVVMQLQKQ